MISTAMRKNLLTRLCLIVIGALIAIAIIRHRNLLLPTLHMVSQLEYYGVLAFIGLYVITCIFLIPGFLITSAAGVLFGVVQGAFVVSIGATLGATIAFLLGRHFARDWVENRLHRSHNLEIIDHAVSVEGWKIVLLARLCPFIPFRISNYVFGLSSISLPAYVIATWLGTLPTAIVYVYLGSLAGELAQLGTDPERNAIKWPLYLGGFFVLALFLTVLTKIAKRALASHDIHGPSN